MTDQILAEAARLLARMPMPDAAAALDLKENELRRIYAEALNLGRLRSREVRIESEKQNAAGVEYVKSRPGLGRRFVKIDRAYIWPTWERRQDIRAIADELGLDVADLQRWAAKYLWVKADQ